MKAYHVCETEGGWDGKALLSLSKRLGEADAIEAYEERWPEADPTPDIYQVHLCRTLEDARQWVAERGGQILEIDLDLLEDAGCDALKHREGHIAVGERIPASCIKVVQA